MSQAIQLFNSNREKVYPSPYYPIGSIYLSISGTNPSQIFGGTWELLCPGRTLVCIDTNDGDFNTVKKIGGSKYLQQHSHSMSESGNHDHGINFDQVWAFGGTASIATTSGGPYGGYGFIKSSGNHTHTIHDNGSGNSQNLQPYMVCYMWVRKK